MSKEPCEQKLNLLVEYQKRTQAYAEAIGQMTITNLTQSEVRRLTAATERARRASMEARSRLDEHIGEHGC